MRIITGNAKGIELKTLDGETTRPTSSRVKEAVFSMLQFDIESKKVLDLFAGSGQMGLEALSRGAREAVFVDKSKDAIAIIKSNINKTKLSDCALVFQEDYLYFLDRTVKEKFDIVFIDPPYAAKMYIPALKKLIKGEFLKESSLIICESAEEDIFNDEKDLKASFKIQKQTKYGHTFITVLSPMC